MNGDSILGRTYLWVADVMHSAGTLKMHGLIVSMSMSVARLPLDWEYRLGMKE